MSKILRVFLNVRAIFIFVDFVVVYNNFHDNIQRLYMRMLQERVRATNLVYL